MTNVSGGTLRRRPAQRRSLERVERMLDECANLLDAVGYEALTTKEVARRAGVPIGTFYQFFPDKQGLVRALALRNLEAFLARITARLGEAELSHWTDVVDLAVDEFVEMKRTIPGFLVVDFGEVLTAPGGPALKGTDRMLDAALENNEVVADSAARADRRAARRARGGRARPGAPGRRRGGRRGAQAGVPGRSPGRPRPDRRVQAAGTPLSRRPSALTWSPLQVKSCCV
ncbi:TetR/AcrR family transcriptional regulator [Thermocatellispora tengchongensis]